MVLGYFTHLLILISIHSILAVSLNLSVGYTGLLNLGHVAFYGIGAYASALLALNGVSFPIALLSGALLAGVCGLLLSFITVRIRGDYLAITTLGFGFIIESFMKNWVSLTRGPLGLPGIPKPSFFGVVVSSMNAYLVFSLIVAFVCIFLMWKITNSSFGRVMEGVRDDELAVASLGKNVVSVKSFSLAISAFFAGIAGSLYAHYVTFIDPSSFSIMEIVLLFSIIIVGGLASIKGSIAGAFLLVLLPEPLRFIGLPASIVGPVRQILYSLILILILYFRPKGLFGKIDFVENNG